RDLHLRHIPLQTAIRDLHLRHILLQTAIRDLHLRHILLQTTRQSTSSSVMASAGLLLLLLMSSSLLVSMVNASPPAKRNLPAESSQLTKRNLPAESSQLTKRNLPAESSQLTKRARPGEVTSDDLNNGKLVLQVAKAGGFVALNVLEKLLIAAISVSAFISPAMPAGILATGLLSAALAGVSLTKDYVGDEAKLDVATLKNEFRNLHSKMDGHFKDLKWDVWAASVYHQQEQKINVQWDLFLIMNDAVLKATDDKAKMKHINEFVDKYDPKHVIALYNVLKDEEAVFKNKFKVMLREHVNCHEKALAIITDRISLLIYKGNTMSQLYYAAKGLLCEAREESQVAIAYDVLLLLSEVHKDSVSHSMECVQNDVKGVIDKHTANDRQKLADDVWKYLNENYDQYDWMVVAFISKHSSSVFPTLRSHILTYFTSVSNDKVTVSVARQVKGSQTSQIKDITDAITSCVGTTTLCYKVAETLRLCDRKVGPWGAGVLVTETYTAVHAFTRKAHDSHNCKEMEEEVSAFPGVHSVKTPYIYSGACKESPGMKGGKFVVMIKSEEEIIGKKNPCERMNCGGGQCVSMMSHGIFRALCECKYPYYGEQCEKTIEIYKKELKKQGQDNIATRNI
ncbi:hypothetical protein AALO_G00251390, partial [Alosa alosa]